jgi:hypothetical protein
MGAVERGERNLSFHNLVLISRALEITLSQLVSGLEKKGEELEQTMTTKNGFRDNAESGQVICCQRRRSVSTSSFVYSFGLLGLSSQCLNRQHVAVELFNPIELANPFVQRQTAHLRHVDRPVEPVVGVALPEVEISLAFLKCERHSRAV